MRSNYRKIYEQYYGKIPTDSDGRKYDIHHKDGNYYNNVSENLVAISIQEHYDLHRKQEDWGACLAIAARMKLSPKEISELATKSNLKRVANGTHPFVGGEIQRQRVLEGTHNLLGERNPVHKLVANGTHNFLGGEISRKVTVKRLEDGSHNFLGDNNPNKNMPEIKCPHCDKVGGRNAMKRWHFDNCEKSPTYVAPENYICPHCGKIGNSGQMKRWHFDNCKLK